jgi:hypothetical protein
LVKNHSARTKVWSWCFCVDIWRMTFSYIIIVDISLRDYYCTIDNWLCILRYFDNNYYFLDRKSGYSLVGKCACKTLWRMSFVRCLHKNIMTIPLF